MSDSAENKHSKVFVGGISIHTTDEGFKQAFQEFGEIIDSIILRDPESNRSRGFGFVTFANTLSVDKVLNARPISIDDREVDVKRAIPKEANNPQAHARTNKVFIGGLPNDISKEELKDFFSDKGEISGVELIYKEGVFKGFGFITFANCDTADKVIVDGEYDIRRNKRFCRVSKAGNRGKQMQPYGYTGGMSGGYPAGNFAGQQAGSAYYGGGEDNFYAEYDGGFSAQKSYMGPSSGGGYPTHSSSGYMGHGSMGSYGSGYRGGHGGGYTGGPPPASYETRYNQQQHTPYSPGPTSYSSDYSYGYGGGHGAGTGVGDTSSGYTGGSNPYKGDGSMRGTGGTGGGRGGRTRYKPY